MPLATQEPGNPLARPALAREAINDVARGWWVLFVVGLVSTVAGGLMLVIDWSVDDLGRFLGTLLGAAVCSPCSAVRSTAAPGRGRSPWACSRPASASPCRQGGALLLATRAARLTLVSTVLAIGLWSIDVAT
jgi:hypothetical protein